jgi:CRP-like cAMP-binding protein
MKPIEHAVDVDNQVLIERALRWTELFCDWPRARIAELMATARLVRYPRGAQVLASDRKRRDLLVVVNGMLEISRLSEEGKKYLLGFMSPGHVVPLVRLLDDVPLGYDYHAHLDSTLIHLPAEAVVAALDADPILWKEVARIGLSRQRDSVHVLQRQVLGSLRRRLTATLARLALQTDTPLQSGQPLSISLSQSDLATMLGVSRQTMNKELRRLSDEGVVEAVYKRITIVDAEKLRQIAAEA